MAKRGSSSGGATDLAAVRAAMVAQGLPEAQIAEILSRLGGAPAAASEGKKGRGGVRAKGSRAVAGGDRAVVIGGNTRDVIVGSTKKGEPDPEALLAAYLRHLASEVSSVSLAGIDHAVSTSDPQERLQLEAVYTALLTQKEKWEEAKRRAPKEFLFRAARSFSALELLDEYSRLVLLGDPGSGKSTFVNFVALCLAGEILGLPAANGRVLTTPLPGEEKRQPWRLKKLLPVLVILRDFATDGLPADGEPATGAHLWGFIERKLAEANLGDFAPHLRSHLLEKGGLVFLDGLDEVPEAERRREQIREAVESFVGTYGKCRFLVTSRTYAYQNQGWRLRGFEEAVLAPFGSEQVDLFVDRWYAHMASLGRLKREDAQGRAVDLKTAIGASHRLQGLSERPLLLTLMASLHAWRGGNLPERREQLYAEAVDLLLDLWEKQRLKRDRDGNFKVEQPSLAEWLKTDREAVRRELEDLAFEAHAAEPASDGKGAAPTADIPEEKLIARLLALARSRAKADPVKLVEYLSQRSGLLVARGMGVYTLPHRTFQEYLAACRLTRDTFPKEIADLARADPNRWREVVLLAGAKAWRGTSSNIWLLADQLCFREPCEGECALEDLWGAHLAGQAVAELVDVGAVGEVHAAKVERLRRWHLRLIRDERLPPRERALAGDTLAALGDPRFDAERWSLPREPLLGFIEIPAGPFLMGSNPEKDPQSSVGETPQHTVDLPKYYIAKWPVTVGQFRCFVEQSGYSGHWYSVSGPSSRPVTAVSLEDAQAYCAWLGKRLQELGRKASGWGGGAEARFLGALAQGELSVKLPSEAEWEKAARGTDGRIYPWEGEYREGFANDDRSGFGRVSVVGCFPLGASPYGVEEVSGNVWEWTRSPWSKYPYEDREFPDASDSDSRGVVCGGAFLSAPGVVRCTIRIDLKPAERNVDIGFRVVVSPFRSEL